MQSMDNGKVDLSPNNTFKVSHYTHVFECDQTRCLLYNAKSNNLARVPQEIGYAVKNWHDSSTFQQLLTHDGIKHKLTKGGFIVEKNREEAAEVLGIIENARKPSPRLGFTIAPTMNCNFSCPYCFEPKDSVSLMSDLTSEKLISFMERQLEGRTNLSLTWYGGEPTLAISRIEQLTERIDKLVNSRHIALFSEIITNGYNLTPKVRERLAACYISRYQITLDGSPHVHDLRRAPRNGKKSFWRIVNNIKALMEHYQVDIRVNIDLNNVASIDEMIEILNKEDVLSHCSLSFSHVDAITPSSSGYEPHCLPMPVFAKEVNALYKRLGHYISNSQFPEAPHTCTSLGPNSFVVDAEGGLYRCWTGIGDKRESIGSVYEPESIECGSDTLASFDIENDLVCRECNILPICLGGCPYKFVASMDSESRCVKWKYALEEAISGYTNWQGKTKEVR